MKFLKYIISTMLFGSYVFLMYLLNDIGLFSNKYILLISLVVLIWLLKLVFRRIKSKVTE